MKKIITIFLTLIFTLGVFAGCGNAKKADSTNTNTKTTAAANTKQAEKAKPASEKQEQKASKINTAGNGSKIKISEDKAYTDKEHVAAYINEFAKLPHNYITKNEAKKLGWQTKGTLDKVAPGKSIGGDRYGNYEGLLPKKSGRVWKECDIDYVKGNRNAKRIVFSSDGLIYYTGDHYKTFTQLY